MSENDSTSEETNTPATPVESAPFDHIIDDTEEIDDCREWIHAEFVKGRDADAILAELIDSDWPVDDAERIVEEGRRATRHLRGVVTRAEIARVAERRYRNSFRHAFRMALFGVPMACAYALLILWRYDRIPRLGRGKSRIARAAENPDNAAGDTSPAPPKPLDSDSHPTPRYFATPGEDPPA